MNTVLFGIAMLVIFTAGIVVIAGGLDRNNLPMIIIGGIVSIGAGLALVIH